MALAHMLAPGGICNVALVGNIYIITARGMYNKL